MGTINSRVSRVASWAGWCSPCEQEDRPLVLTRSGPGGVGGWLSGMSDEDRVLLLTCRVCGHWQVVPAREEDDPEVVLEEVEPVLAEVVIEQVEAPPGELVAGVFAELSAVAMDPSPAPVAVSIPAPRPPAPPVVIGLPEGTRSVVLAVAG